MIVHDRRYIRDTAAAAVRSRPTGTLALLAGATLALVLLATLLAPARVGAAPKTKVLVAGKAPTSLSELRAEAARVKAQIRRLDEQIEIVAEEYNAAREELDAISAELMSARSQLGRAQAELALQQQILSRRVATMYKTGQVGLLDLLLTSHSLTEAETQFEFFSLVGRQDAQTQQSIAALVREIELLEQSVANRRDRALALEQKVAAEQAIIEDKLLEREGILAQLDDRIRKILDREAALDAATAERLARAAGLNLARIAGTRAQIAVVRESLRYLGVPYVWGGTTPAGFDCSGLVMYVFARFGVQLPHYSGYQARLGHAVALNALQPGDLVFFGTPVHHVGIYAGSGLFIHAPHTGDVVKVSVLAGYGAVAARRFPLRMP